MNATNDKMTPRQSWALFCATKIDVRACDITKDQASGFIDALKAGGESFNKTVAQLEALPGASKKGESKPKQDWQSIYDAARAACLAAGHAMTPTPMVVQQHADQLDDTSPVVQQWHVSEGVCGFAGVIIKSGNSSFARWCSKNKIGHRHYYGGWYINVSEFNQSYERKTQGATAMAEYFRTHGIECYVDSRLD